MCDLTSQRDESSVAVYMGDDRGICDGGGVGGQGNFSTLVIYEFGKAQFHRISSSVSVSPFPFSLC